jgi:acetolactate synthase-1/2/3 large subunit
LLVSHGLLNPAHVHAVPVPDLHTPPHSPPAPANSLVVPAHAVPAHSVPAPPHSLVVGAPRPRQTVAESLVDTLVALGVEYAFGVFGGGIGPFCRALGDSPIQLMHYRHEAGAAFAAIEASLASDKLVVVVATTGPGLTNLYTGMVAARWEGAKVLFVSGHTPAERRGRRAFQETSSHAPGMRDLFEPGSVFHHAAVLEHPAELLATAARLRRGVNQPGGFVAHLGLSLAQQTAPAPPSPRSPSIEIAAAGNDADAITACANLLAEGPFVIWAGFGARHAADEVRALAELTGARVMCSPRGKGVFPENHPLYLGVTGLGGHPTVLDHMRRMTHGRVLVLGSQLGEMTSFWSEDLVPPGGIVHIDLDSSAFGAAYPHLPTFGFTADIRTFVGKLIEVWPARSEVRPVPRRYDSSRPLVWSSAPQGGDTGADDAHGVRPSALMAAVQREIVEQTAAIVMTEAGNSYAFGSHYLRFEEPRYRSSTGFGAMGHATSGVLGAALASKRKAVAIVGDGALLMQNEINTAATYGIDAVWVVLNDSGYRMIAQGMRSAGWQPFETEFVRTDFVAIARAMGADGVRVEREADLGPALARARAARGPFLVDVIIDPREQAPNGDRNRSLQRQGLATD